MAGSLVADLAVGPEVWLFVTLLSCLTIFFKFSRFWSVRNLDLFLLFALAPGMMMLVGSAGSQPWAAYLFLFMGTFLWLARCLLDLGMTRRPLLEPNLNAAGLACLSIGVLGLFVVETVSLSVREGSERNPADANAAQTPRLSPPGPTHPALPRLPLLENAPLANSLKANPLQGIARILASIAQLALVVGLVAVGWIHFEQPISGLAAATCYLLLPYARFALVDSGQLLPAAVIVGALVAFKRPVAAALMIGFSAGWMPACIGLLPLWAGFYRGRAALQFGLISASMLITCILFGLFVPGMSSWATALGARSLSQAGVWPATEAPDSGSFWSGIDPSYRLPVWIGYLALVVITTFWPAKKNLAQLISSSAALLLASQFWYLAKGGTLVLIHLPLVILMMFRPNLGHRRGIAARTRADRAVGVDV